MSLVDKLPSLLAAQKKAKNLMMSKPDSPELRELLDYIKELQQNQKKKK